MNEGWMKDEWRMIEGLMKDEWRMIKDEWRMNEEWMKDEWRINQRCMKDESRMNKIPAVVDDWEILKDSFHPLAQPYSSSSWMNTSTGQALKTLNFNSFILSVHSLISFVYCLNSFISYIN